MRSAWISLVLGLVAVAPTPASTFPSGWVTAKTRIEVIDLADLISLSIVNLQDNPIGIAHFIAGLSFTVGHIADRASQKERAAEIRIDRMGRILEAPRRPDIDWKFLPFDHADVHTILKDHDQLLSWSHGTSRPPPWTKWPNRIHPDAVVETPIIPSGPANADSPTPPHGTVPEPETIAMVAAGAGLLWIGHRRRTQGQKV